MRSFGIFHIVYAISQQLPVMNKTSINEFVALTPLFNFYILTEKAFIKNEQSRTVVIPPKHYLHIEKVEKFALFGVNSQGRRFQKIFSFQTFRIKE